MSSTCFECEKSARKISSLFWKTWDICDKRQKVSRADYKHYRQTQRIRERCTFLLLFFFVTKKVVFFPRCGPKNIDWERVNRFEEEEDWFFLVGMTSRAGRRRRSEGLASAEATRRRMKKVIDDGWALNSFDHGRCLLSPVQNGRAHSPILAVSLSLSLPFVMTWKKKKRFHFCGCFRKKKL